MMVLEIIDKENFDLTSKQIPPPIGISCANFYLEEFECHF